MTENVILTEQDIRRTLTRIAHEIVESNRGFDDLILIGIRTRGYPLAQRIAATLSEIKGESIMLCPFPEAGIRGNENRWLADQQWRAPR